MRRLPSFLQTSLAMLFAVWAAFVSASEGALPPTLRVEPNLRSGDWPRGTTRCSSEMHG